MKENSTNSLYDEWLNKMKSISTMYLSISVGELMSRYEKGRLKINPAYQRHYRWDNDRKSKLIESILLGYPIPPIFVYEDVKNQQWEVIDGLQRLATIFEFTGCLKNNIKPQTKLEKLEETSILKTMKDATWKDFIDNGLDFVFENKVLQVVSLDNKNEIKNKYEIFRRLNSSAITLSEQEIRNATMYELTPKSYEHVVKTISELGFDFLSSKDKESQKSMELFLEFLLLDDYINGKLTNSMSKFLKGSSTYSDILNEYSFDLNEKKISSGLTSFVKFYNRYSFCKFKNYDKIKDKYTGQFVNFYFELLASMHLLSPRTTIKEEEIKKLLSKKYEFWQRNIIKKTNPPAKVRMLSAYEYAYKQISSKENCNE